jgi:hypothetical protein
VLGHCRRSRREARQPTHETKATRGLRCGHPPPLVEVGGPPGPTLETKATPGLRWMRLARTISKNPESPLRGESHCFLFSVRNLRRILEPFSPN